MSGRDVLVENGRIAAVRPAGEFSGFAGKNAQVTLRGGITSARDCSDLEYNALTVRAAIDAARQRSRFCYRSHTPIDSTVAVLQLLQ